MESPFRDKLDSEKWGEKIRALRKEKEWSQRELAERLDVHSQTVSDIERGRSQFTLERLNRILEALGYEAVIELTPLDIPTRADWGAVAAREPALRRRVKRARQMAEDLAEVLYSKYDVSRVCCFGSLAEQGGANFTPRSDVDLMVEGLDPSELFESQGKLEVEVVEPSDDYRDLSFDLIRVESFEADPDELADRNGAVLLPRES